MAINVTIAKHAVANATKCLAATGGKHIYNLVMDKDRDNGQIVAKGDWDGMEKYKVKGTVTGFTGVILEQAANGNWYVEVTTPGDGILICTIPMIYEEYSHKFTAESNFYNAQGDVARGYELATGDIFEVSAEAFSGTPAATKTLTIESNKLKVAA